MADEVMDKLAGAKAALAHANTSFPVASAPVEKAATPKATVKTAPLIGEELVAKKTMVDKARSVLPRMHQGGPVMADGAYQLKAGEHVLTAAEAGKARKHALMASGMKSLARPGKNSEKKKA